MEFASWLERKKMGIRKFSRIYGMHPATVYRLKKKIGIPSGTTIRKIETVTDGQVTSKDIVSRPR